MKAAAPTAANAEYYARIVRDKAIIRNLIHASNEVLRDAYLTHPEHRAFGRVLGPVLDEVFVIDFWGKE